MKSAKYLDLAMQKCGFRFDKELAKKLNLTGAAVCQYRSGKRIMDNETCVAVAILLEIDPLKVIMDCDMDRAERSGQKSLWEVFMTRTQTVKEAGVAAALALVFVTNILTPIEAKAAPAIEVNQQQFILCQINDFNYAQIISQIYRSI
ncbi:Cro/Cl family transcriptional regulator [Undibacterium sp. Ji22W]|uniref:Cro/Cl family transcriptional regulator n=1 Tax=Undibacterium sp. Ji22W TaxID=3413038 RepID=UPI003BF2F8AD